MNTRIGNEPLRIIRKNNQMVDQGRYVMSVPGPGDKNPLILDPQIRLQKWGANIRSNTIRLQDEYMRGMSNESLRYINTGRGKDIQTHDSISYPFDFSKDSKSYTEQTRTICPAWTLRGLENNHWKTPLAYKNTYNPSLHETFGANGREDGRNYAKFF